ncbi:MAG: circadian clock protein KaiB [Chitinophagaceae bacterium]|nr:MAG: circadian clock protein KaiB [Chitinophagaceae bacterium]
MTSTSNSLTDSPNSEGYVLRLFIVGTSTISVRAIQNLQRICDEYLEGNYELEIIDAHQQPLLVAAEDVTAIPMLIKKSPGPKRRLVGDMSNTSKVLKGLGILTIENGK